MVIAYILLIKLNRIVKDNRFLHPKKRYIMQKRKKETFLLVLRLAYKYLSFINVKISLLHPSAGYLNMWPLLHQLIMYFWHSFLGLMANRFIIHDTDCNFIIFRNFLNFYRQQTSMAVLETCEYGPFILVFCVFFKVYTEFTKYFKVEVGNGMLIILSLIGTWHKSCLKKIKISPQEGHKICWK